jgi:hypothetical protein
MVVLGEYRLALAQWPERAVPCEYALEYAVVSKC